VISLCASPWLRAPYCAAFVWSQGLQLVVVTLRYKSPSQSTRPNRPRSGQPSRPAASRSLCLAMSGGVLISNLTFSIASGQRGAKAASGPVLSVTRIGAKKPRHSTITPAAVPSIARLSYFCYGSPLRSIKSTISIKDSPGNLRTGSSIKSSKKIGRGECLGQPLFGGSFAFLVCLLFRGLLCLFLCHFINLAFY